MFVYVSRVYTASVSGQAEKRVECEFCGQQFSYLVQREAKAEASAPFFLGMKAAADRAEKDAMKKLDRALRNAAEPVPCPACANYQRRMFAAARAEHRPELWALGSRLFVILPLAVFGLIFVGGFGMVYAERPVDPYVFPTLAALVLSPFLGLLVQLYRWLGNRFYNPNAHRPEEERRVLAKRRVYMIGYSGPHFSDRQLSYAGGSRRWQRWQASGRSTPRPSRPRSPWRRSGATGR